MDTLIIKMDHAWIEWLKVGDRLDVYFFSEWMIAKIIDIDTKNSKIKVRYEDDDSMDHKHDEWIEYTTTETNTRLQPLGTYTIEYIELSRPPHLGGNITKPVVYHLNKSTNKPIKTEDSNIAAMDEYTLGKIFQTYFSNNDVDIDEWIKALKSLNFSIDEHQMKLLFHLINKDSDETAYIDKDDFIEFAQRNYGSSPLKNAFDKTLKQLHKEMIKSNKKMNASAIQEYMITTLTDSIASGIVYLWQYNVNTDEWKQFTQFNHELSDITLTVDQQNNTLYILNQNHWKMFTLNLDDEKSAVYEESYTAQIHIHSLLVYAPRAYFVANEYISEVHSFGVDNIHSYGVNCKHIKLDVNTKRVETVNMDTDIFAGQLVDVFGQSSFIYVDYLNSFLSFRTAKILQYDLELSQWKDSKLKCADSFREYEKYFHTVLAFQHIIFVFFYKRIGTKSINEEGEIFCIDLKFDRWFKAHKKLPMKYCFD
eukprot:222215_1